MVRLFLHFIIILFNYILYILFYSRYSIPPEHGRLFERLASRFFSTEASDCPAFLRHKTTIISPNILKQNSIPFDKVNN